MARLVIYWAEPALEDLDRVADYIALDKPLAARNLVKRVMESVERLSDFPESGSKPKELKGTAYRHLVIPPLRVFYRVMKTQILILHVKRGENLFHLDELTSRNRE
jgi:toxin ParE1/3/4